MSTSTPLIGSLEFVAIRDAFRKEPRDFTTWLETHIDELGKRLRLNLSDVRREVRVGDFILDLLCQDEDGGTVIIENQLERTDHDHLGKVLTYLVNMDAATAVWITTEPRAEHRRVVDWLNQSTPDNISFFLVKVEGVRIGTSPLAPLFTVLASPDAQTKQIGEGKKELADRHLRRREFWTGLVEKTKGRTRLFANISPGVENWISTGAGKSGVSFQYWILLRSVGIQMYIDYDTESGEKNKAIFDALHAQKDAIERDYGGPLEWERKDHARSCRIGATMDDHGLMHRELWPELQDKMIDGMIRLDKALRHRLAEVRA